MKYWLAKSEPDAYSFQQLLREGRGVWDGVRNYTARNHLRAMAVGDLVLFYHSNIGKEIVGVARVSRAHFPDPTAEAGDWSSVEVVPEKPLKRPVTLAELKADAEAFSGLLLLRQSRLSVMPVSAAHFKRILRLSGTSL